MCARVRVPGSHLSRMLNPRRATLVSGCLFSCFLEGLVASLALQKWKHTLSVSENELQPVTPDWHLGSACPRRHFRGCPWWPRSARRFSVLGLASLLSLRSAELGQGRFPGLRTKVREDRSGRQERVPPGLHWLWVNKPRQRAPSITRGPRHVLHTWRSPPAPLPPSLSRGLSGPGGKR